MGSILSRIEQLAKNEGLDLTPFETKIGASKGVLTRAKKNKTDIQLKWILTIVENYPLYNIEWLMTGKGRMLKASNYDEIDDRTEENSVNNSEEKYGLENLIYSQQRTIENLSKAIDRDSETIERLIKKKNGTSGSGNNANSA